MAGANKSKVLAIGLDGGTWTIFQPLIEAGFMPNLAALVQSGATGVLKSVVPPVTAPAWVSFATGLNPIRHGVFDFRQFERSTRRETLVNAASIRRATLWQFLSEAGKKSILVNVPITFPPEPIDGIIIPGLMSPGVNGKMEPEFCYPPEIGRELVRLFPEYRTFVSQDIYYKAGLDEFISQLIRGNENQLELSLHLMQHQPWDFFMVHFQNLDSLQHALWPWLIESLSGQNLWDQNSEKILNYFQNLDDAIGRLAAHLASGDFLILLSDHGFGPLDRFFNLNEWLRNSGWLNTRKPNLVNQALVSSGKKLLQALFRINSDRVNRWQRLLFHLKGLLSRYEFNLNIDWLQSPVYAPYGPQIYGLIYLMPAKDSQRESNRSRLVTRIARKLLEIREPDSGELVVEKIYRTDQEDLCPFPGKTPDLIVQLKPGFICNSKIGKHALFEPADRDRGTHQSDGMVLFTGGNIKAGSTLANASLVDLLPTILSMFEVCVPSGIDGRLLSEIFTNTIQKNQRFQESEQFTIKEYDFSPLESEIISQKLRDLGYLN